MVVVLQRLKGEVLAVQILPHALEVQPLIAGEGEVEGVGLAAVIAVRNVDMIVDVLLRGVEDIVQEEAPVVLRSLCHRQVRRGISGGFLRRLLRLGRGRGLLRSRLGGLSRPAGAETQLHGYGQQDREQIGQKNHGTGPSFYDSMIVLHASRSGKFR